MKRNDIPSLDIDHFLAANNEIADGDGFFITNDIYPYLQSEPNRLAFYAIALCNGGLYRTSIDLKEYVISAGCFMALRPYQTVNQLEIKDYAGMLLIFNKDFFLRSEADRHLLQSLAFFAEEAVPVVEFPETGARILMDEFITLRHKAARTQHPYRKEIVRNLLVNLLYELDSLYRDQYKDMHRRLSHKEQQAARFRELLTIHFRERHEVQFYAEELHVNPKYLSELLRETMGKNASELINGALVEEARILLKNTTFTVSQIATTLNFSDNSAFVHFFNRHTGLSPLSYRKQLRSS